MIASRLGLGRAGFRGHGQGTGTGLEQDIVDPLQAGLHIALPPARIRVTSGPRLRSESRAAPAAQTERYPTVRGVRKETRRGKWRKEGARENGENGEGGKGRRQGGQDPCGI